MFSEYDSVEEFLESKDYDRVMNNKYLSKLIGDGVFSESVLSDGSGLRVPTDEMLAITKLFYEIIKPLFGYGSYLDMFEYDILSYTDYLALFVLSMRNNHGEVMGITEDVLNYVNGTGREILTLRSMYTIWYNNYRDQLIETRAM